MIIDVDSEDYIAHYGILRKSGRYPWGSGKTPEERGRSFLTSAEELRKKGLTDAEIARGLGLVDKRGNPSTTMLRAAKSIAVNQRRQEQINQAQRLQDKGLSNVKIGERMGINESTVRSLLAPGAKDKADILTATANMLKDQVEQKKYLDVGIGTQRSLPLDGHTSTLVGISETKFKTALAILQAEDYKIHYIKIPQQGTGELTTYKILTKPDVSYSEAYANRSQIKQIAPTYSEDGGRTYKSLFGVKDPISIHPSRVGINYKEDGGTEADGVIYVRPGVKDLSLGTGKYAQVRIKVGDGHYLKGMAVYKDDLPSGKDLVFNTNKSDTGNKLDALKPLKTDPTGKIDVDNPFGAVVRQITDEHDNLTSAMNIVNEEGDWSKWSKNIASQVLSKQSPELAKQQLDMRYEHKRSQLDRIEKLTNPVVKQKLLDSFADDADSSAVHLKAAALPRQASHVLLPLSTIKPTEVYAPNHNNGERVVLIRYPHAGTFEIPELTVNNRQPEGKAIIGNSIKVDAIGIHPSVAERLSGADFDGDAVLVIPNDRGSIKTSPSLAGLKNFDPKASYPPYDGMKTIDGGRYDAKTGDVDFSIKTGNSKQQEMGKVTNLISDMTIHGATSEELARAVRHSMVVIDAEKHHLDYKASAKANGIAQLKAKYQLNPNTGKAGGASTLITRAKSEIRVPKYKPRPASEGGPIDRETGKKVFVPTGETYVDRKTGKTELSLVKSRKLVETDDASTLLSGPEHEGTPIERLYADHSNRLKALANEARKESVNAEKIQISPSAKQIYNPQVKSLDAKLNVALRNAPLERQAQVLAETVVAAKRRAYPDMDSSDLKKIKGQALVEARLRTGAKKEQIDITPEEWNAIQAGAVSTKKLNDILNNTDLDKVKELATPRTSVGISSSDKLRAESMIQLGYSQAEIANQLGVSVSTLKRSLKGEE